LLCTHAIFCVAQNSFIHPSGTCSGLVVRFANINTGILITCQSDRSVVTDSLKADAIDFGVKTFDQDRLLTKVAQALPA
jgi:DNA-binding NtrC family response regulator